MTQISQEMESVGLTKGEASVYLALLDLGSSTVGPIVKKSGVAYSNIYEILERLMKKGLASFIIKNRTRHFQAASPENFREYLEKKEAEIERQKKVLSELIPKIATLQRIKPEQEAEIFVGLKGLKAAYTKLVTEHKGGKWLFFYIHREEYAKISDNFYRSISKMFRSSETDMRGVSNTEYRKSKFVKIATFMKVRYADFPIPGNIEVYNDNILIVSWSPMPVAFLIKSRQVADMLREYFESAWKMATK